MRPFDTTWASQPAEARQPEALPLSRRVTAIAPSPITEVDARLERRAASGSRVIQLDTCEPPLATPGHVVEAAVAACRSQRMQRPTPTGGLPELREAIAAKVARDSGFSVSTDEVVVTSGVQQSAFNAMAALVDAGDEVLVPSPYRSTYPAAVELAGGRSVSVPASMADAFKITVDHLKAALSPRTKVLLLSSPCNPTGAVYTPEELQAIGTWAIDEGLWVITDETYEHFVYGGAVARSLPALVPAARDRCIVINSVATAYGLTGWRVGWLVGPARVAAAIGALQSHTTSHASNVAQAAAVAALDGGTDPVERLRDDLDRRRLRLCARLRQIPGVEVVEPMGALHAFPLVEAYLGGRISGRQVATTLDLCAALVELAGVAVAPGEAFGRLGHLGVSFALAEDDLEEGIARLVDGLGEVAAGSS